MLSKLLYRQWIQTNNSWTLRITSRHSMTSSIQVVAKPRKGFIMPSVDIILQVRLKVPDTTNLAGADTVSEMGLDMQLALAMRLVNTAI